jgi:formate dehydrogenase gamma subunit
MIEFAKEVLRLVSFRNRMAFWILFPFVFFTLPFPLLGQSPDTCLMCHSRSSLTMTKRGRAYSLYVKSSGLAESVHSLLVCVDCHRGFSPGKIPHAEVIRPVQCQGCHEVTGFGNSVHGKSLGGEDRNQIPVAGCKTCHGTHEIFSTNDERSLTNRFHVSGTCASCHKKIGEEFLVSAHGVALVPGGIRSPSCVDCHGAHNIAPIESSESPMSRANEIKVCLGCHLDDPEIIKKVGISAGFIAAYKTSVHGMAVASGNQMAASCSDCHGSHDLKKASDPSSRVNRWIIVETCARCHSDIAKIYNESIHGKAHRKGIAAAPTCTDCHGEHQIYAPNDPRSRVAPGNISGQVCATCHNSVQLNEKYGLPSDRFNSFSDSYHGLASRAGSVEVANCASCHGSHNIKPSSDPTSTINKDNLAATCGRCHPGANSNFAKGSVHLINRPGSEGGILNWIRNAYIILIVTIIGSMFLHNLLDFFKKTRYRLAVRRGEIIPAHYGRAQYVRMTLNERIQHAIMLVSFILLAVTGFMLRYPDSWWVVPIRQLSDRFFEVRGVLHRVAGAVLVSIGLYHLFCIFFTKHGREFRRDMLPRWSDVGGAWRNLLYIAGFSRKKPRFGRFGYVEKTEYWALFWGAGIMAATGIILWFDTYFMALLTKQAWDIAQAIHFYEACLASLAILVWHFYFVIFNPNIYPMSTAWLNGKISEEEMAEEHPLELARIKK